MQLIYLYYTQQTATKRSTHWAQSVPLPHTHTHSLPHCLSHSLTQRLQLAILQFNSIAAD